MSEPITHHYYVDHRGSMWLNEWKYYRVTGIYNMHIEVCEVEFPSLKDVGVPVQHAWVVGLAAAWDIQCQYLLKQHGIVHEDAILFGSATYDENGKFMPLMKPSLERPKA